MPLVRGRGHSENLTILALLCEQMLNEKERQTKKKPRAPQYSFAQLTASQL